MALTDSQKVDYLYKKLGYGVAKTDIATNKSPSNEGNASPLLTRGDSIWVNSDQISSVTVLPTSNSSAVTIYRDSLTSTVQCTKLPTTSANVSWATNLTNWVPVQFGSGYQVKLYAGPAGSSTPQNFTNLPADGSGNNDSWFFDYQSGIVNFGDTNVPTAATTAGNVVYVVGARYTGNIGLANAGAIISGTVSTANVAYYDIVTSTNANDTYYPAIYNFASGNLASYTASTITFNPASGNLTTSNVSASFYGNITGAVGTISNVIITNGVFWANGVNALTMYGNTQVAAFLTTYTGNISASNVTVQSNFYGNIHTDLITPYQTSVVTVNTNTALGLPVGGNVSRPASPVTGLFRYNTEIGGLEVYTGTAWNPLGNNISGQDFYGDGVSQTYVLTNPTTATGILVSINGTIQQPGIAYTVTDNQITFAEIPLATDLIDIRYLAGAAVANFDQITVSSPATTVLTSNTVIDSFSSLIYRSAKYIVSGTVGTDAHMAEIMVTHINGTTAINALNKITTGSNNISYSASVSSNNIRLTGIATANASVRIQRTYFNV